MNQVNAMIEKDGTGIEKDGTGIEKDGTGIEKDGTGLARERRFGLATAALLTAIAFGTSWAMADFSASKFVAPIGGDGSGQRIGGDGTGAPIGGDGTGQRIGGDGTGAPIGGDGTGQKIGGDGTGDKSMQFWGMAEVLVEKDQAYVILYSQDERGNWIERAVFALPVEGR